MVLFLLVLQHGQLVRAVRLKLLIRPSSVMVTAYICTGEPLPYQFKPKPSPEGNNISADVPGTETGSISDDLGHMD